MSVLVHRTDLKYNSVDELNMWYKLAVEMASVPNDYRSRNHHAYLPELKMRVHELIELTNSDESDYLIF